MDGKHIPKYTGSIQSEQYNQSHRLQQNQIMNMKMENPQLKSTQKSLKKNSLTLGKYLL